MKTSYEYFLKKLKKNLGNGYDEFRKNCRCFENLPHSHILV